MGLRGPAPTPKNILKLRGSPRGKHTRRGALDPPAEKVAMPRWLGAEAKRCWRRVVPRLELLGVVCRLDRNAISRYCVLWSRWRSVEKILAESGETYTVSGDAPGADGKPQQGLVKRRPEAAIAIQLAESLTRLEDRFGLTPSARANVRRLDAPRTSGAKARKYGMIPPGA